MKNKLFNIIVLSVLFTLFHACTDITDTQKEWLDKGETKYVGKLDSIKFRGGLNRVQMQGLTYWAKTAVRGTVSWGDQKLDFNIEDLDTDGNKVSLVIENLPEAAYQFTVQLFDDFGNKSVPEVMFGYTYDAFYKLQQEAKYIVSMEPFPNGTMKIIFNSASEDAVSIQFKYENSVGVVETKMLPGNVSEITIPNYKKGGQIELITNTLPEEDAYDIIALDPYESNFPTNIDFPLDRTKFLVCRLPTDCSGDNPGASIEAMWDNNPSTGYHSIPGQGIPHHLTIDLGVHTTLNRMELTGRADFTDWNPEILQIWGIESLENAETTLASMDAGWEAEAVEKGWKLLFDETLENNINNEIEFKKGVDLTNIRYIRYRVVQVFGIPYFGIHENGRWPNGNMQEINIWAEEIKEIAN